MARKKVLLHLTQLPQDTSSGAARSMRTMAEMLAQAEDGDAFEVRAVATTATEHGAEREAIDILRDGGYDPVERHVPGVGRRLIRCAYRGVSYALLDIGSIRPWDVTKEIHAEIDKLLLHELDGWNPDIAIVFGGQEPEMRRRFELRKRGAIIVFGLRNHGYFKDHAFIGVDLVITPSQFLTDKYHKKLGLESVPLPTPMEEEDIVADQHQPIFASMVNPAVEKGLLLFVTLAEELSKARPDLPIMVVESRGTAGLVVKAGLAGGFDLRRHKNIQVSEGVSQPKHIYAVSRTLLVPSVWEEPSGRVSVEAMLNGVPPIVSDRGGLGESIGDGGIVEHIPTELTLESQKPLPAKAVRGWMERTLEIMENDELHAQMSARARAAAERYLPHILAPRYVELLKNVQRLPPDTRGPGMDR